MTPEFLTLADIGRESKVPEPTIRNWIREGRLMPSARTPREYLFAAECLPTLLADIARLRVRAPRQRQVNTILSTH
jgi:hypothetical protein